jgi:beta-1,4-N-acetylglucosaminyltransferase
MIFVTVGTTDFDALVSAADQLAASIDEEVVIQIGQGKVEPSFAHWFRLAPSLEEYYRSAGLIITHGGLGTVTEVVRLGVPVVGVSNPDRYDQHQDQILQKLEEAGHLVWCRTLVDLPEAVMQARQTTFAPYQPPESRIHEVIQDFLHDLAASLPD